MENKETAGRDLANQRLAEQNKLETARKEGRAKGVLITAIISLLLLLALGVLGYSLYNREHNNQIALMENQKNSFMEQLTARDSMINDWLSTFDQIEKNLTMIKEKEKLLTVKSSSNTEVSKNRKEQIMEDIKSINNLIDENKKKIANLSAQLKKSGNTIKGLEERIATLEATTKQYENDIAELRTTIGTKDLEIGQLNTTMVALNDTLTHKNEKISVQTSKLHQGFLVAGTFKDLKAKGLLTKEGGFLGLGRKENLIGDFPDNLFTEIDVTQTKSIPVNSKSAKLITEHPTSSYEMIREGDNKIASIEIKDPQEFWKVSKYAVVELIK
jgi:flagellar biosynthesis chaperone FliJ